MFNFKRKTQLSILLVAASLCYLGKPGSLLAKSKNYAQGTVFGAEYIDNWEGAGCGVKCEEKRLKYTSNQMKRFVRVLRSYNATRKFFYSNNSVNPSDLTEDGFGGEDNYFGDQVDLYAYSGHGIVSGDSYQAPMCKGTSNDCSFDSRRAVWGESSKYSPFEISHNNRTLLQANVADSEDISKNTGKLRWVLLATCESVDGNPFYVWSSAALGTTFEFLMGYRGTSADSSTTDEVPEDWVKNAFKDRKTFRASWFSAAEDWSVDDTAGAVAFDNTRSQALYRLRNQKVDSSRRQVNSYSAAAAWSWHEG